jgi:uncharacterized protein (TIGR00297 family)
MIAPTDWIALAASLAGLSGLVAVGEGLRRLGCSPTVTRHIIHIGVGAFVASTPVWFTGPLPVAVLAVLFVGANGWAKARHWFPGMHAARPESWGTVAFPLAVLPALAATWAVAPDRIPAFQAAFVVLAVADPVAAWVGRAMSSADLRPPPDRKTLAGSAAFAVVAAGATAGCLLASGAGVGGSLVAGSGAVGLIAAAVEVISGRGWDNFFVVQAVVVAVLAVEEVGGAPVLGAVIASGVFVVGAHRTRALDRLGAIGGGLLAVTLLVLGGWAWAVPAAAFFILSSALSKLHRPSPADETLAEIAAGSSDDERGRTLRQVLANGGAAWLCLIAAFVFPDLRAGDGGILLYAAYVGAFATATADTWATEIGTRVPDPPIHITTLQRVPAGTSGAISLGGTLAGGAGALCIAALAAAASPALSNPLVPNPAASVPALAAAGFTGMMMDTVFGATLQVRYRDPGTERLVEDPPRPSSRPVRGWRAIDNDGVNALATTAGGLLAAGLMLLWFV